MRRITVISGLGHIDAHAELLITIADATGREVIEEVDGDYMIASPGDSPESVKDGWSRRRTWRQGVERRNRVGARRKLTPEQLQELADMVERLRAERDNLPHGV